MYFATGILFLLPSFLLYLAWRSSFQADSVPALPTWRKNVVMAAFLMAGVATLIHLAWNISWLHCGGSPHGMGAGPGIWQSLGRPLLWTFGLAIALSFFAKGKGRYILLGWSVSMYFVFEMIYMLQFD
jgi:hypothetical protein